MKAWVLIPPVAFSLIMLAVLLLSGLMKRASFIGPKGAGAEKPYSCGEDLEENAYRPEYGQFFSFAFFFTIMHVAALVVATIPGGAGGYYPMAALYLAGALIALGSLVRKDA
jgi:NADH:ubiquinone oxidoreductase subunit 3 (subunit A)